MSNQTDSGWGACPPGEVSNLVARLILRKRLILLATVTVSAVAVTAVSIGIANLVIPSTHDRDPVPRERTKTRSTAPFKGKAFQI